MYRLCRTQRLEAERMDEDGFFFGGGGGVVYCSARWLTGSDVAPARLTGFGVRSTGP